MRDMDRQVDQEQPNEQIAGDRLLKALGIDPNKWTAGDRRIALLGIGIVLTIVIIAVCGYAFEWAWTGLTKPQQRTFWDWLSLLIVPIVLALGGYLFTRSESRRTKEDAERQRAVDREIADERRQDDTLQTYLDQMGQLLLDKDRPLRESKKNDEVRTLARARTITTLGMLDPSRKATLLEFLYESGLIEAQDGPIVDLQDADLREAHLDRIVLRGTQLSGVNLEKARLGAANLDMAHLRSAKLRGANLLLRLPSVGGYYSMWGATVARGYLRWADLQHANLTLANLTESDFNFANLSNANLTKANLGNTDLTDAKLHNTDLTDAKLHNANFKGADLSNANLTGATDISEEKLEQQAFSLQGATMPNGQMYEDWLKSKGSGEDGKNSSPS
jgi:uncharacterized protein YjbI with pentapeptide repeats